jgi:hypothetical protein
MRKEIAGFKFITDNGFCSELPGVVMATPAPVVELKKETVVMIEKKEERLEIPQFMKDYSARRRVEMAERAKQEEKEARKVVYVDFKGGEEEVEELSLPEKMVDGFVNTLKNNPVTRFFFDIE